MKLLFSLIVTIAVISPISLFAFQLNSSSRRLSTLQRPLYAPSFPSLSSNVFHNSFSPLYSSSFTLDQSNNISKENNKQLLSKIKNTFLSIAKHALPIILAFGLMYLLNVPVSMAASKGRKAAAAAVTVAPKSPALWRKILEGANVTGNFKKWKPGDTRSEFAALVNAATTVIIMFGLVIVGSLNHLRRVISEERNMKSEVIRVKEYKENMYFDAVDDILKKLADPKLKSASKTSLQAQLKDLDPDGTIARFVRDGGDRPDISNVMGKKPKKGARKAGSGSSTGTVEKRPKPQTPSRETYKDDDDDADTSNSNNEDDDDDEDRKKPQSFNIKPSATRKPTNIPSSNSNTGKNGNNSLNSNVSDDAGSEQDYSQPETYQRVLAELGQNVESKMANWRKAKLIAYLKTRIEGTVDDNKRAAVVSKIADRVDQVDYWVEYASKLQ